MNSLIRTIIPNPKARQLSSSGLDSVLTPAHYCARAINIFGMVAVLLCSLASRTLAQSSSADPVLAAMKAELERSKEHLKLEGVAAPYYIDYHVFDVDEYRAEAAFGAVRTNVHTHLRFLRVIVRIGDYKQDSFFGQGQGIIDFAPVDDDIYALRHQLWLATDRAYKAAAEALAAKQSQLKQLKVESPVDDFAHAEPVKSVGPVAKLDLDLQPWLKMLAEASAVYKADPQVESMDAGLQFQAVNRYFANSEGSVVRSGQTLYNMDVAGSTQASDGMRLNRSWAYAVTRLQELPSADEFVARANELLSTLRQLREAPVVEEEYRGPVLFSADASSSIFADFIGENVLGLKPNLGQPAHTKGAFATSYSTRVLPEFLSVLDDPTVETVDGKSLMGHYEIDDEGVKAQRVQVIEKGKLENYVIGREPIRDFVQSNGHGRARIGFTPGPSLGNLIVRSSDPVPRRELKKKLIELCQQRELSYGYYVDTLGPRHSPRLLYRVYVKDGHEELVRGAIFGDLDTRSLRSDVVAAGDDVNVENRVLNIPHSIVNPSILFDELEVKRANANKEKLPEYGPPPSVGGNE